MLNIGTSETEATSGSMVVSIRPRVSLYRGTRGSTRRRRRKIEMNVSVEVDV